MNEQESNNLETNIANTMAHQALLAFAIGAFAKSNPDGVEILKKGEAQILERLTNALDQSHAPDTLKSKVTNEVTQTMRLARGWFGLTG
jgi:acylphosphatase